ncbi:MAG: sporulation stage IV protein A [Lachnospirales bacterium]
MIKSNINANVATVVGTEEQSKELVDYLNTKYNNSTESVLEYEIFGRSLSDLINDDLNTKILRLNEDTQSKIQDTIEKILNTGHGGIICILL